MNRNTVVCRLEIIDPTNDRKYNSNVQKMNSGELVFSALS